MELPSVEKVQKHIDKLRRCCLGDSYPADGYVPKKILAGGMRHDGWWSGWDSGQNECSRYVIYRAADRKVWVCEDDEDYTGHGCQCGSLLNGPHDTIADAVRLGLTQENREHYLSTKRKK